MQWDTCANCCRKHLRKAMVTWGESRLGHPEKLDASLGNLAEAADAILLINEDFAVYLREIYLKLDADKMYPVDWKIIFENIDSIQNQIKNTDKEK